MCIKVKYNKILYVHTVVVSVSLVQLVKQKGNVPIVYFKLQNLCINCTHHAYHLNDME